MKKTKLQNALKLKAMQEEAMALTELSNNYLQVGKIKPMKSITTSTEDPCGICLNCMEGKPCSWTSLHDILKCPTCEKPFKHAWDDFMGQISEYLYEPDCKCYTDKPFIVSVG